MPLSSSWAAKLTKDEIIDAFLLLNIVLAAQLFDKEAKTPKWNLRNCKMDIIKRNVFYVYNAVTSVRYIGRVFNYRRSLLEGGRISADGRGPRNDQLDWRCWFMAWLYIRAASGYGVWYNAREESWIGCRRKEEIHNETAAGLTLWYYHLKFRVIEIINEIKAWIMLKTGKKRKKKGDYGRERTFLYCILFMVQ